jgi:prohibitin 2
MEKIAKNGSRAGSVFSAIPSRLFRRRYDGQPHTKSWVERNITKVLFIVAVAIVILVVALPAYHMIPAGHVGVVMEFGKPVAMADEGLYIWFPSWLRTVVDVPYQTLKYSAPSASAGTKDLQSATTTVVINYHLDKALILDIYRNLNLAWESRVINPAVEESLKATTAEFTAEELITRRPDVKNALFEALKARLTTYGIVIEAVSITDFQFSPTFQAAVEAKVTAEQNALKELNVLRQIQIQAQQKVAEANGTALAAVLIAQGQANATIISAEAQAQAIQLINEQLQTSVAYIQYQTVLKWDGAVPVVYVIGEDQNGVPFIFDISSLVNSTGAP